MESVFVLPFFGVYIVYVHCVSVFILCAYIGYVFAWRAFVWVLMFTLAYAFICAYVFIGCARLY